MAFTTILVVVTLMATLSDGFGVFKDFPGFGQMSNIRPWGLPQPPALPPGLPQPPPLWGYQQLPNFDNFPFPPLPTVDDIMNMIPQPDTPTAESIEEKMPEPGFTYNGMAMRAVNKDGKGFTEFIVNNNGQDDDDFKFPKYKKLEFPKYKKPEFPKHKPFEFPKMKIHKPMENLDINNMKTEPKGTTQFKSHSFSSESSYNNNNGDIKTSRKASERINDNGNITEIFSEAIDEP